MASQPPSPSGDGKKEDNRSSSDEKHNNNYSYNQQQHGQQVEQHHQHQRRRAKDELDLHCVPDCDRDNTGNDHVDSNEAERLQPDQREQTVHQEFARSSTDVASPTSAASAQQVSRSAAASPSLIERWTNLVLDSPFLPSCSGFLSPSSGDEHDTPKNKNNANIVSLLDQENGDSSGSNSTLQSLTATTAVSQDNAAGKAVGAESTLDSSAKSTNNDVTPSDTQSFTKKPATANIISPTRTSTITTSSYKQPEIRTENQIVTSHPTFKKPRRKNRATSVPKHIRHQKLHQLLEEIQHMPTPSVVRNQVLAVHDLQEKSREQNNHHTRQRQREILSIHTCSSSEEEEEEDDDEREEQVWNLDSPIEEQLTKNTQHRQLVFRRSSSPSSSSSSSSYYTPSSCDNIPHPLSSTISSPYYSPSAANKTAAVATTTTNPPHDTTSPFLDASTTSSHDSNPDSKPHAITTDPYSPSSDMKPLSTASPLLNTTIMATTRPTTPSPLAIKQHRRVKSFQTPSTSTPLYSKNNKSSPTSVADMQSSCWDDSNDDGVTPREKKPGYVLQVCGQSGGITGGGGYHKDEDDEDANNWIETVCPPCGYYPSDGGGEENEEDGTLTGAKSSGAGSTTVDNAGCGGYIDYGGIYHACTNVRGMNWQEQCQGCIFRQGAYDGGNGRGGMTGGNTGATEEEELYYYDSDPGQYFAPGSWTCPMYRSKGGKTCDYSEVDDQEVSLHQGIDYLDQTPETVELAKLKWRNRIKKRSRHRKKYDKQGQEPLLQTTQIVSQDDSATLFNDPHRRQQQQRHHQGGQKDQQAYLYDYFSRRENISGNVMKTGPLSTNEKDAGDRVQVCNIDWLLSVSDAIFIE